MILLRYDFGDGDGGGERATVEAGRSLPVERRSSCCAASRPNSKRRAASRSAGHVMSERREQDGARRQLAYHLARQSVCGRILEQGSDKVASRPRCR